MRVESSNLNNQYTMNPQGEIPKKEVNAVAKVQSQEKDVAIDKSLERDKQLDQEHEVIVAIEKANKHFKTFDRRLEFSIHDKTKEIMVKVINTEDDSIVREIPSEKILDMVAKLWEMTGIFVDEKR